MVNAGVTHPASKIASKSTITRFMGTPGTLSVKDLNKLKYSFRHNICVEKKKKVKGYGLLPPGRRDKIAIFERKLGKTRPVQFGRWARGGLIAREQQRREEGKKWRAGSLLGSRLFLEALLPPKQDLGPGGGINRAALYLIGGKKGRERARELRQEVKEKIQWSQLPIVERQVKEIIKENDWQHHFKDTKKLKKIVDKLANDRAEHYMWGRGAETAFYWGLLGWLGREVVWAPLLGGKTGLALGGRVAGRAGAEVAVREAAEFGAREVAEEVGMDLLEHEAEEAIEESTKLNRLTQWIYNRQKKSMRKQMLKELEIEDR